MPGRLSITGSNRSDSDGQLVSDAEITRRFRDGEAATRRSAAAGFIPTCCRLSPAADCDPDGLFLRQTCESVGDESQPRAC